MEKGRGSAPHFYMLSHQVVRLQDLRVFLIFDKPRRNELLTDTFADRERRNVATGARIQHKQRGRGFEQTVDSHRTRAQS